MKNHLFKLLHKPLLIVTGYLAETIHQLKVHSMVVQMVAKVVQTHKLLRISLVAANSGAHITIHTLVKMITARMIHLLISLVIV